MPTTLLTALRSQISKRAMLPPDQYAGPRNPSIANFLDGCSICPATAPAGAGRPDAFGAHGAD
jgi:hypothetical protein